MHVQPYLMFPGTCRDALDFYATALGGASHRIAARSSAAISSASGPLLYLSAQKSGS